MCTLMMSFEDPLSVAANSRKSLVVTAGDSETSSISEECPDGKEQSKDADPEAEGKASLHLYNREETQPAGEPNTEEQNVHHINANNWCIAVVTIVLCFLFFLYYCF